MVTSLQNFISCGRSPLTAEKEGYAIVSVPDTFRITQKVVEDFDSIFRVDRLHGPIDSENLNPVARDPGKRLIYNLVRVRVI